MNPAPRDPPEDPDDPDLGVGSDEMFEEIDGVRVDEHLHEELFADGAEEEGSLSVYEEVLDEGMDPELAERLFG